MRQKQYSLLIYFSCCVLVRLDDMAKTNHPIGKRLRDTQRESIEGLWKRATAPDGPDRIGLPARCDKDWFCNTFCGGNGKTRSREESIWDLVLSFVMCERWLSVLRGARVARTTPAAHVLRGAHVARITPAAHVLRGKHIAQPTPAARV